MAKVGSCRSKQSAPGDRLNGPGGVDHGGEPMAKQDSTEPGEVRQAASHAAIAADAFARAVAEATTAGITVDGEVYECAAQLSSWAAWLAARAAAAEQP